MKLYKTTPDAAQLLIENLELADNFWSRAQGLLGRRDLPKSQALWIKPCRDIHTFFMKFAIDCVFLDREMKILRMVEEIKPFRLVGPFWKATSVIEFRSGFVADKKLSVGDQLYVVN